MSDGALSELEELRDAVARRQAGEGGGGEKPADDRSDQLIAKAGLVLTRALEECEGLLNQHERRKAETQSLELEKARAISDLQTLQTVRNKEAAASSSAATTAQVNQC